jgi:hypothetical protein
MSVVKSRYSILSNKPTTEDFSGELNELHYNFAKLVQEFKRKKDY